ncbi:hypothetical protein ACG83_00455 [Frankia sp. R43]|nr:hypothetical protein ACG83_00455 [Frankia sp. R43]
MDLARVALVATDPAAGTGAARAGSAVLLGSRPPICVDFPTCRLMGVRVRVGDVFVAVGID